MKSLSKLWNSVAVVLLCFVLFLTERIESFLRSVAVTEGLRSAGFCYPEFRSYHSSSRIISAAVNPSPRRCPATRLRSNVAPFLDLDAEWYEMEQCLVLVPKENVPRAIIHFIGGFIAGASIPIAYSALLSTLSRRGYLIVATPIPAIEVNHDRVADSVTGLFSRCYQNSLNSLLGSALKDIPIIGLSHSLGGKITVLMNSNKEVRKTLPRRIANIFIAFNNYGVQDSIDRSVQEAAKISPDFQRVVEAFSKDNVKRVVDDVMQSQAGGILQRIGQVVSDSTGAEDFLSAFDNMTGVRSRFKNSNTNQFTEAFSEAVRTAASEAGRDKASNEGYDGRVGARAAAAASGFIGTLRERYTKGLEFIPSPEETWQRLVAGYNVRSNYLIKFRNDEIDMSSEAASWLQRRGCDVSIIRLAGNHLTPNAVLPEDADTPQTFRSYRERFGIDTENLDIDTSPEAVEFCVDGLAIVDAEAESINQDSAQFVKEVMNLLNRIVSSHWDEIEELKRSQRILLEKSSNADTD